MSNVLPISDPRDRLVRPTFSTAREQNRHSSAAETLTLIAISLVCASLMIRGVVAAFHDLVSYLS